MGQGEQSRKEYSAGEREGHAAVPGVGDGGMEMEMVWDERTRMTRYYSKGEGEKCQKNPQICTKKTRLCPVDLLPLIPA